MTKSALDEVLKKINDKYGIEGAERPAIMRASEMEPVTMIPTASPALTYVLGGGWPKGKLIELFGKEGSGKTTLMLLALKDCYDFYEGKRKIAFIDVERRFNPKWAYTLGVPVEDLFHLTPENAERGTDMMRDLARSKEFAAIGFDSIGAALPSDMHETFDEKKTQMGGVAKVMARNVGIMAAASDDFGCTSFYTNQVRADMQGWGRIMTPGGHPVKHLISVRLYLRPGKEKWYSKTPEGPKQVGFPVIFKTYKHSFAPPFRDGWSDFFFEPSPEWLDHVGFDTESDVRRLGLVMGVVKVDSSWYEWSGIKVQGRDKFFAAVKEAGRDEEFRAAVEEALRDPVAASLMADEEAPEALGPEIEEDPDV